LYHLKSPNKHKFPKCGVQYMEKAVVAFASDKNFVPGILIN
jgi:hypothetical protein